MNMWTLSQLSLIGSSVGIIIPDTVEKETLEFFEQILMQLTSYQEQKTPEGIDAEKETELIHQSTSERIASGLVAGIERNSKITNVVLTWKSFFYSFMFLFIYFFHSWQFL